MLATYHQKAIICVFTFQSLVLLTTSVSLSLQATFEQVRHCPSYGPTARCHCEQTVIECHTRGLTTVPTFTSKPWMFRLLDLENNSISTIPARAFININVTEIDLRDNQISYLDPEAFTSLHSQLTSLDLRGNMLTVLPAVFSKMSSLNVLDVSYNPIPANNFTDTVMRELGDFIHEFHFGDPSLDEWPTTISHLQALQILKFYEGRMSRLPITAFSNFKWQLRKLWIQNTHLIAVPIALQDLKSLYELHFDNNVLVEDAGILIPAFAGLTSTLQTLSLENNTLTTFPLVLSTLTSLANLSLSNNDLQFVSDQSIGNIGSNLTTLNLQNCNLDRIPGALSNLPGLINLDFSYNRITSIEKTDLQNMHNLQTLNVSYNPLQYVSKNTFTDLNYLQDLMLRDTSLEFVPEALHNVPQLQLLDLTNEGDPKIECNCDLSWLYCYMQGIGYSLRIRGACFTIEMGIEEYAENRIPVVCPIDC